MSLPKANTCLLKQVKMKGGLVLDENYRERPRSLLMGTIFLVNHQSMLFKLVGIVYTCGFFNFIVVVFYVCVN